MGINAASWAAGELCSVPDHTPERPDGHECGGKYGVRLQIASQRSASAMIVKGVNVDNEEDTDDNTTALCGAFVAIRLTKKRGHGVPQ